MTVYWLLLAVLVPMSLVNFSVGDTHVSRSQQAVLNLAQALLATICALALTRLTVATDMGLALKALATFFLVFQGILIPLLFSALWFLNWQRAASLASTESLSPGWLSAVSGIAALAVSILQYRLAAKKRDAEVASQNASPIIIAR